MENMESLDGNHYLNVCLNCPKFKGAHKGRISEIKWDLNGHYLSLWTQAPNNSLEKLRLMEVYTSLKPIINHLECILI